MKTFFYLAFSPLFILFSPIGLILYYYNLYLFSILNPKYREFLKSITVHQFEFKKMNWMYVKKINNVEFVHEMNHIEESEINPETKTLYCLNHSRHKGEAFQSSLIEMNIKETDLSSNLSLINTFIHTNCLYMQLLPFQVIFNKGKTNFKISLLKAVFLYPYGRLHLKYANYQDAQAAKNRKVVKLYEE